MHETGLVQRVLRRAEAVANAEGGRIVGLSLRIGSATGIDAESVQRRVEMIGEERWGFRPMVDVQPGEAAADAPEAHGLSLLSVRLEG